MGTHQSWDTGSRELRWLTILLYQAKEMLQAGQHARCMHVVEQVRGTVGGSQQVGSRESPQLLGQRAPR